MVMRDERPHHRDCPNNGVDCECQALFRRDRDERDDDPTESYRSVYDPDWDEPARRGRL